MQKVFDDSRILDKKAREKFSLSEEMMMENAAAALENEIESENADKIVILCGSGNNGADGFSLARRLFGKKDVVVIRENNLKTQLCALQAERAQKCGVKQLFFSSFLSAEEKSEIESADVIVDCAFGAGFHGKLPSEIESAIKIANKADAIRIACDIPSGLDAKGCAEGEVFCADKTISMGSLKTALFSDTASDFTGEIKCADLGISRYLFEKDSETPLFVLDKSDLLLPSRKKRNTNKGSFGHAAIFAGDKAGAAVIGATAAFSFGAGLVSVISGEKIEALPFEILQSEKPSANTSAIAVGMGFGSDKKRIQSVFDYLSANKNVKAVLDADLCHSEELLQFLENEDSMESRIILTPHPKEFLSLLKNARLCDEKTTVRDVVNHKLEFALSFSNKYKKTVLISKGAIPIISGEKDGKVCAFFNPFGQNCLAKGGSGDVLSGLALALLAQGRGALDAAISASLSHALASRIYCKENCDYAMSPFSLIDSIKSLGKKL